METKKMAAELMMAAAAVLFVMAASANDVSYDGRSLIINGTRSILFSGSIHYPRSTPQMWPYLITQAKRGGIDVIQTYAFWNVHEPKQGQYNFEGRYDLVRFIKEVQNQGLYVSLRIGPFIESEWKYGGFPFWLHGIPGIVFRSDNEPFKFYMQNFTSMIVNMMKSERLYASQGGPIILSQIENEYKTVEGAFHERGPPYVRWAASMAVGLKTGVPWMMCKQDDAPDPVINTCNGMKCGETFAGPNSPNKPALWTENWTSQYQVFGGEPYIRSAEDIAFHVGLFIAKMKGSFVNYYMYHGGTNLGKSASAYVTTSYYDEAPLDEYGLIRQPKWGHLRELHAAVKSSSDALLRGKASNFSLGEFQQAYVFEADSGSCAAFLVNNDATNNANVQFNNFTYQLPHRSISILPDCQNVVFNTATVRAQYSVRSTKVAENLDKAMNWEAFADEVPKIDKASFTSSSILDQLSVTKDETDYLWYTTSFNHTSDDQQLVLQVNSKAHVIHAFVNDVFIGTAHGAHNAPDPVLKQAIEMKNGLNDISLLSVMVGSPDSGAYLERRFVGLLRVSIEGEKYMTDLSDQIWGYQAGLQGESVKIYSEDGSMSVKWQPIDTFGNQPFIWYKTQFSTPLGKDPVVLNLKSMSKGEVWINGESIGRYWVSFLTPQNQSSQYLYHIPREFLKPSGNLLVLVEEMGGDPLQITVETVSVSNVCNSASNANVRSVLSRRIHPTIRLHCYRGKRISAIEFASGDCNSFSVGSCQSNAARAAVEEACLGKKSCSVSAVDEQCLGSSESLMVMASCS